MLRRSEPSVTIKRDGPQTLIELLFVAQQKISVVVQNGRLSVLTVTLQAGQQASIAALEDAQEVDQSVRIFDEYVPTTYETLMLGEGALVEAPMHLRLWALKGGLDQAVSEMIRCLSASALVADGSTNHFRHIADQVQLLKEREPACVI